MALTEKQITILREARKERRTEEFLKEYKAKVEESRVYHDGVAARREPSPERMREVFNFILD